MAIGHTNSLDTAVHEYGIRQRMISRLSMDLRESKRSLKLQEMEQAQEEDRRERQKSKIEPTERRNKTGLS